MQPTYHEFLQQHGKEVADYYWSGYVMATLLVCLKDQFQIDVMKSEFDELSAFLCKSRGATYFIFTYARKREYMAKLGLDFPEQALRDYFNNFMPIRLADNFPVPGSATVSVAPVGVSPTDLLSTNRIGTNNFNGTVEEEAGIWMLDGVRAIGKSLAALDQESVVIFSIA